MNQAPTHAGFYSHALIDSACYAETYERIKETSGKELVKVSFLNQIKFHDHILELDRKN
jgi:hypothetical protein